MNGLSIGRIVHYRPLKRNEVQAAIVTKIVNPDAGIVHLTVFPAGTPFLESNILYSEHGEPGTWGWPPKA